ncbi:TPA: hypothetical protein R4S39_004471 [Enterobacter hormaechei subsp. hormaechei]|nr:hypothetical protein [Enterobacter hormaechei subsp. hormaechei]
MQAAIAWEHAEEAALVAFLNAEDEDLGRAGACSYHGGVNHSGGFILLISLALAGYTFYQVTKDRTKK